MATRKLFTTYHLSDFQLRMLSQIVNNRQRNKFGPSLEILLRHDLVAKLNADSTIATEKGKEALAAARREGW